jgi:hypothetical protein
MDPAFAETEIASPHGFVRLVVAERLRSDPAAVARLLQADRPWAALQAAPSAPPGMRRFALDLKLRVGGDDSALTTFDKAAYLDLGRVEATDAGWLTDIGWQAATLAPLFPVFAGRLSIEDREVRIEGLYAPPGGIVGRVADRILFHIGASGTARWLLNEIDMAARQARD